LENKIKKLNFSNLNENSSAVKVKKEQSKFSYNKDLYSDSFIQSNHIYEELSMGDCRLESLHLRVGYPYLYRHMEHCDHIILLCDVRLADAYDSFIKEQRCLVTYQRKIKRRICDACAFYYAKFMSINDKIGGENSSKVLFFCEYCIKKLHAKEANEGTIYSVKLIPYYHD
jgi:RNase P subunit RPR2